MKKYLTLLVLVMISCKGYGQMDTLKVLMFYSDTTQIDYNFTPVLIDSGVFSKKQQRFGYIKGHVGYVFWQYGYEVYKDTIVPPYTILLTSGDMMPSNMEMVSTYKILVQRLDADKKSLSKNIVVWQAIKL